MQKETKKSRPTQTLRAPDSYRDGLAHASPCVTDAMCGKWMIFFSVLISVI